MATPQSQAVGLANQAASIAQQILVLRATVNDFITQYNDTSASTIWNALATCAQNADGSLGTADGTPNTAHPIDNRVITGLTRATSATNLTNLVAALEVFQNFLTGSGGNITAANRNAVFDLFSGS